MKKNDYLLAFCLLIISLVWGFFYYKTGKDSGLNICVYHDNELIGKYSLLTDGLYEINVSEGFNVLKIEAGKAFVVSSDCLTGECVHMQPIEFANERIICLPHHLVFEISGYGNLESTIDGVTY